jgi:hypothetical protein
MFRQLKAAAEGKHIIQFASSREEDPKKRVDAGLVKKLEDHAKELLHTKQQLVDAKQRCATLDVEINTLQDDHLKVSNGYLDLSALLQTVSNLNR